MKKISKLNDVAFHLINKVNKKKLKINTLLIKNWEKIFGINHHFVKIKKITLLGQADSLNLEFKIDSSKSFELHSKNPEIKLKCEAILGAKVNKILFFQACSEILLQPCNRFLFIVEHLRRFLWFIQPHKKIGDQTGKWAIH